jgi:hypothetical protein
LRNSDPTLSFSIITGNVDLPPPEPGEALINIAVAGVTYMETGTPRLRQGVSHIADDAGTRECRHSHGGIEEVVAHRSNGKSLALLMAIRLPTTQKSRSSTANEIVQTLSGQFEVPFPPKRSKVLMDPSHVHYWVVLSFTTRLWRCSSSLFFSTPNEPQIPLLETSLRFPSTL